MSSVALATCRDLPSGDEDADSLRSALAELGVEAAWQVWDDPCVDWSQGLVVLRSTWDYTANLEDFLAWAAAVPRLANSARVIAWNCDKTYLRDLAEGGVPIVATTWVAPGEPLELPVAGEYVIKPSVGAGSKGAGRFAASEAERARAHAAHLHAAGRSILIQPYLSDVDQVGEASLIYLDGTFSHAITKGAMLPAGAVNSLDPGFSHSLYAEERISPKTASAAELAVGEQVVDDLRRRFGADVLYARVDLLPGPAGPLLVELELTEPSLFLGYATGAAERFAKLIAARA